MVLCRIGVQAVLGHKGLLWDCALCPSFKAAAVLLLGLLQRGLVVMQFINQFHSIASCFFVFSPVFRLLGHLGSGGLSRGRLGGDIGGQVRAGMLLVY